MGIGSENQQNYSIRYASDDVVLGFSSFGSFGNAVEEG